jgi:hypothetical protein
MGTTDTLNLLRYAPEERPSPRELKGKELQKNKYNNNIPKIKSGTLYKIKPKKHP